MLTSPVIFLLVRIGERGRLVALDYAEKMLEKARAKGFDRDRIDFLCADVTNLPLYHEIFDAAVCYSSFPHFRDKLRACAEINRVLKPGGRLFVCHTSSRYEINQVHRSIPAVQSDLIPQESEMRRIISAVGFVDVTFAEDSSEGYLVTARKPE